MKKPKQPSPNPQTMRDGSWFYEDRWGIDVIPGYGKTQARIPWSRITRSMERCGYRVTKVSK